MRSLITKIIVCALLCLALGTASSFSTMESISTWYQFLNKPAFNPPNWIFGPVWTILYIMMGISVALVWHTPHADRRKAMIFFAVQFILNLCWSFLFFNLHLPGVAYFEIMAMCISIALTIIAFYKINKTAALLLLPYLCWVLFATILNYSIWILNR
ncbi:MAG TPA: TspO/MBR family protein [Paludibacter sp.]